jgi:hypothetical protein
MRILFILPIVTLICCAAPPQSSPTTSAPATPPGEPADEKGLEAGATDNKAKITKVRSGPPGTAKKATLDDCKRLFKVCDDMTDHCSWCWVDAPGQFCGEICDIADKACDATFECVKQLTVLDP